MTSANSLSIAWPSSQCSFAAVQSRHGLVMVFFFMMPFAASGVHKMPWARLMIRSFPVIRCVLADAKAPNILSRSRKLGNVATGLRLIDCLFPIGTGQRELIIGDRQTGKSTLAISILLNLASRHVSCLRRKVLLSVATSNVINPTNSLCSHMDDLAVFISSSSSYP